MPFSIGWTIQVSAKQPKKSTVISLVKTGNLDRQNRLARTPRAGGRFRLLAMKIYMVWVYDWPQRMILVTSKPPIEGVHNRQNLSYKYKNPGDTITVYFREKEVIKNIIDYFELEPDQIKEIDL